MSALFNTRSGAEEIMDDLNCSGEVVFQTLRELEFINKWLGGNDVTLDALSDMYPYLPRDRQIRIADLGCGGGDMLRHIHRWAGRRNLKVDLLGIDANSNIISYASTNVNDLPGVAFAAVDIFSENFKKFRFDVVIGTLFYHHFSHDQLVGFFRQLRSQVNIGFIINDIHRHPLAYHSIRMLTNAFSRSAMVRYDAPLSVLRAFTRTELQEILLDAGYSDFSIKWKWAFRWQVVVKV